MDAFPADISEQWLIKAYTAKLDAELPDPGRKERLTKLREAITGAVRANAGSTLVNVLLPFQPTMAEALIINYELGFRSIAVLNFDWSEDAPSARQVCVGPSACSSNRPRGI